MLENRLDKAMIKYNEAQSIRKTYEQIVKRLKASAWQVRSLCAATLLCPRVMYRQHTNGCARGKKEKKIEARHAALVPVVGVVGNYEC